MTRDATLEKLRQIEDTHIRGFFCRFQQKNLLNSNRRALVVLRRFLKFSQSGFRLYSRRTSCTLVQYTLMPEHTRGRRSMFKRAGPFCLFA
jgi:hypothetical protein